jgi:hypothetical protein
MKIGQFCGVKYATHFAQPLRTLTMAPLHLFNEGQRSKVYKVNDDYVLKVPNTYQEPIYDEDGMRQISYRNTRIDHDKLIKPGFYLAAKELSYFIPPMIEIKDFDLVTHDTPPSHEKWGFVQEKLEMTLGEKLDYLFKQSNKYFRRNLEFRSLRKQFMILQYHCWLRGVWDHDFNFVDNYGLNKNGKLLLLDIDALSATNSAEYPYSPQHSLNIILSGAKGEASRIFALSIKDHVTETDQLSLFNSRTNR